MRIRLFAVMALLFYTFSFTFALAKNTGHKLRDGAAKPQVVFSTYANAVKRGDIGVVKSLVYSKGKVLWERSPRKMLAMSKGTIPDNPILQSIKKKKEYQYQYAILAYRGISPATKRQVNGEVWMIVEDGGWKVYNMIWK
ncbi:MAG: hypothetical protein K8T10_09055 [Candidatus Eremiobacteraeota bacterium]|nr:hypothetical protein [Candidatus Eremiobacteraeota bacterium]